MSSLKKIILGFSAFVGLAIQSNVSAYNVAQLKKEVMLIEHYAGQCPHSDIREWLQNTIASTYLTNNYLIVSIAATITDKHLNNNQKDGQLFCILYEDKKKWRSYEEAVKGLFVGVYLGLTYLYLEEVALRWLTNHDVELLAQARNQAREDASRIVIGYAKKK
jgi:hypothetical protein